MREEGLYQLRLTDAKRQLRRATSATFTDSAIAALGEGWDSPALVQLAISGGDGHEKQNRLLDATLDELGLRPFALETAIRFYIKHVLSLIVSHQVDAFEGANEIGAVITGYCPEIHDYDLFIYAASEYEDRPEDRNFFADAILKEAQRQLTDS